MVWFEATLNTLSGWVWGPVMLTLLVGVGLYLTAGLRAMPWRKTPLAFRQLWQSRQSKEAGDISPFQALMTALAATVGTGNIAGVATAIFLGGPGAVFWMWITALFGMATKYAEAVLAVHYRETNAVGNHVGGPMYYIKNGLGPRWQWLAVAFALFGMLAAFGIGNTVQANSVAHAASSSLGVPPWLSGLIMMTLAGAVILGGIKRIGAVAAKLVPLMALIYLGGSLFIIFSHLDAVPAALATIVNDAFTGSAAAGGFAGASVWMAIRFGVARGIFSNEAGLGSAPIAHAAAATRSPVHQGSIAMLGTLIDTLLICTMTALVIMISGLWNSGETGAALSAAAFNSTLPGWGGYLVSFGLMVFAFTTILGWSYYGERCAEYLFGKKVIWPYRLLWIVAIPIGAISSLELIWLLADVLNGLMALPNLIALLALSPLVFKLTREHFKQ
ncbi:MAG: sodium:alanine symporter family protein [Gammaproteobacteria bacterium]|nr:sodium:alanine symporter family protein [Gammaproteobacteria bacterium]